MDRDAARPRLAEPDHQRRRPAPREARQGGLADQRPAGQALGFLQGLAVRAVEKRYLVDTPPAQFRVNVNPLVSWIWVGGGIAVIGGLIAIWPAPAARRRRVSDVYAARLARELERA